MIIKKVSCCLISYAILLFLQNNNAHAESKYGKSDHAEKIDSQKEQVIKNNDELDDQNYYDYYDFGIVISPITIDNLEEHESDMKYFLKRNKPVKSK